MAPNQAIDLAVVITTIQAPTAAVTELALRVSVLNAPLVIIGDKKGPFDYPLAGAEFFSLQRQLESRFKLARALPVGHYTRKNIGYLEAIARGAACIYETDDDNAPLANWVPRQQRVEVRETTQSGWVNVYRLFSRERIWPRGFPLDLLHASFGSAPALRDKSSSVKAPIQQGLANGSPDVDAIWRLVLDAPVEFEAGPSVVLPTGAWCPFNSQSTWWWPSAYPLMYLPSHCSFRMTDIWRSFIAQRCLWELGYRVVFHGAEVFQERNEHNLMHDFADEVCGYLRNSEFCSLLDRLDLEKGKGAVARNLLSCYRTLVEADFFPSKELELLEAWLHDLAALGAEER